MMPPSLAATHHFGSVAVFVAAKRHPRFRVAELFASLCRGEDERRWAAGGRPSLAAAVPPRLEEPLLASAGPPPRVSREKVTGGEVRVRVAECCDKRRSRVIKRSSPTRRCGDLARGRTRSLARLAAVLQHVCAPPSKIASACWFCCAAGG
ncbi:hypothetical protein HPB50_002879 [Hyalomma asiaticum]|uniref:Uncharacterized protein n=1 Tax=Hyalomma asiaticum TaxID=266040 RepID=A0ACB7SAH8_HYAAI|nr:hypothetical protein HPB50_002879 [Hyalomma asiaticum]